MKLFIPIALALCASGHAGTVLFSDLGPGGSFSTSVGSILQGSNGNTRQSITQAREFAVSGTGNFDVTEFDLAVFTNGGGSSFAAAIFTNNGALPGTQIGSSYDLTANTFCGATCYSVASQTGVTGITLTGGSHYWMVLGPQSLTDSSENIWRGNDQGATSLLVASLDGGQHWITENGGLQTNAAFSVVGDAAVSGVPEPSYLVLVAGGLLAVVVKKRVRPVA